MADNPEPPEAREFDRHYDAFRTSDWADRKTFDALHKALADFLAKHRELYSNKYIVAQIGNAREHCKGAGVKPLF